MDHKETKYLPNCSEAALRLISAYCNACIKMDHPTPFAGEKSMFEAEKHLREFISALEVENSTLQARLMVVIQERDKWKHTAYHAATMI